ncbi:MAG: acyl carrier protein [bacterium]
MKKRILKPPNGDQVLRAITTIIVELLGVKEQQVSPRNTFLELGADSVGVVAVLKEVEIAFEEFQIKFEEGEISPHDKIEKVINSVQEKI